MQFDYRCPGCGPVSRSGCGCQRRLLPGIPSVCVWRSRHCGFALCLRPSPVWQRLPANGRHLHPSSRMLPAPSPQRVPPWVRLPTSVHSLLLPLLLPWVFPPARLPAALQGFLLQVYAQPHSPVPRVPHSFLPQPRSGKRMLLSPVQHRQLPAHEADSLPRLQKELLSAPGAAPAALLAVPATAPVVPLAVPAAASVVPPAVPAAAPVVPLAVPAAASVALLAVPAAAPALPLPALAAAPDAPLAVPAAALAALLAVPAAALDALLAVPAAQPDVWEAAPAFVPASPCPSCCFAGETPE